MGGPGLGVGAREVCAVSAEVRERKGNPVVMGEAWTTHVRCCGTLEAA